MNKPKVGDRFFLVKDIYRTPKTSTVYVKKVGRKYFWVGERGAREPLKHLWTKFCIDGHRHAEEFGSYSLYKSEQDYLDKTKADGIFNEISSTYFRYKKSDSLTLDKLTRIKAILKEGNK